MPGTYSQLLLHIVFSTKGRTAWITHDLAQRLYPYLGGIIRAEKGVLYDIGGFFHGLRGAPPVATFRRPAGANCTRTRVRLPASNTAC